MNETRNIQQDYIQFVVSKVSLYGLPSNLNLDSIDFEQCILECIKNKVDEKKPENGLIKRIINEVPIQQDLLLSCDSSTTMTNEDLNYSVAIYKNKLLWTVTPKCDKTSFDIRESNCYLQSCFDEIKFCYVNYQMPTLIIWLILSIPKKVVKNVNELKVTKFCDSTNQTLHHLNHDSLFALVWKCFSEQDVVQLRETYKYLQSLKRLNHDDSFQNNSPSFLTITCNRSIPTQKHLHSDGTNVEPSFDHLPNKMIDINEFSNVMHHHLQKSSNRSLASFHNYNNVPISKQQQTNELMLTRQRQPAKIIHEKSSSAINLKSYLEMIQQKTGNTNMNNKKKSISHMYNYLNKSESEFDTTQINLYLRNKRFPKQNLYGQTRSRSVDSSRQIFHEVPIKDGIENVPINVKSSPLIIKYRQQQHDKNNCIRSFDILNSEGSSMSDESSSGEFNDGFTDECCHKPEQMSKSNMSNQNEFTANNNKKQPAIVKSVLKKSTSSEDTPYLSSSSSSTTTHHKNHFTSSLSLLGMDRFRFGNNKNKNNSGSSSSTSTNSFNNCNKKNVTFSAYATIQVVDT